MNENSLTRKKNASAEWTLLSSLNDNMSMNGRFSADVQLYLSSNEVFMRIKRFDLCFQFWYTSPEKNEKLEMYKKNTGLYFLIYQE